MKFFFSKLKFNTCLKFIFPRLVFLIFLIYFIFPLFIFSQLAHAVGTVGVKPMTIDLELSPGRTGEFHIEVFSTSPREDTPVRLSLFDAVQKKDGSMDFVDVGKNPFSASEWIRLERTDFTVPAGEAVTVRGEIFAPRGASGMRIATIMVEPGYEKRAAGVTVRVRYAVVLRLNIKGRAVVESAKLESLGIKRLADGTPAIEAIILNNSETDFTARGRALIQDSAGRIIANIDLTTESLERKKDREEERNQRRLRDRDKEDEGQRLYPGSKVAFFAKLAKLNRPMPPGEYTVILNMRYGKRSLTAREKIKLTAEDIASLLERPLAGASFEIRPRNLEIRSLAGSMRSAFFNITNITEEPIKVALSLKDIEYNLDGEATIKEKGSTPYSSSDWITLEKTEYIIRPRLSQTVSMRVKVPDAAQAGGRYSQVVVEVGDKAGNIEKDFVEVAVIVPGKVEPALEIKRFERMKEDKGGTKEFVVDVKNSSAIHLTPKGRVVIRDIHGNEVEQIELKLKGRAILPQTDGRMTGEPRRRLIPGEYTANAEIDYGGKERATSRLNFVIK